MHCTLMIHLISAFETVRTLLKIFKTIHEKLFLILLIMQTDCLFSYFYLTCKVNDEVTVNEQIMKISALFLL